MANITVKGALIEYASDFLGPLPNVVVFQFNPDQLQRTLQIPNRPTGANARESNQAGDVPVERIELTVHLTADDPQMPDFVKTVGIHPPLAALEKMVRPQGPLFGENAVVDAVGDAVGGAGQDPVQLVPRQKFPRLLFVWGATRVLPVQIASLQITEKQYDFLLNPVLAEVVLSLEVITPNSCLDDRVAKGASTYSEAAKEAFAALNLGFAVRQAVDMVRF